MVGSDVDGVAGVVDVGAEAVVVFYGSFAGDGVDACVCDAGEMDQVWEGGVDVEESEGLQCFGAGFVVYVENCWDGRSVEEGAGLKLV